MSTSSLASDGAPLDEGAEERLRIAEERVRSLIDVGQKQNVALKACIDALVIEREQIARDREALERAAKTVEAATRALSGLQTQPSASVSDESSAYRRRLLLMTVSGLMLSFLVALVVLFAVIKATA